MEFCPQIVYDEQVAGQEQVQRVGISVASAEVLFLHLPQEIDGRVIQDAVAFLQDDVGDGKGEVRLAKPCLAEHEDAGGFRGKLVGILLTEQEYPFHGGVAASAGGSALVAVVFQGERGEAGQFKLCAAVQLLCSEFGGEGSQTGAELGAAIAGVLTLFAGVMDLQIVRRITVLRQKLLHHLVRL